MERKTWESRCERCFGRGYLGGGTLPTCRVCRGASYVIFATEAEMLKHQRKWQKWWDRKIKAEKEKAESWRK